MSVPVREIHEIELSSICTLACVYCPHPMLQRPKAHMPWGIFDRTMEHLQFLVDAGTQGEVSLCGIGEAIIYPQLEEAVARIRSIIGPDREFVTSTNGTDMTPEIARMLARYGVGVYVSLHRPEVAAPAIEMLKAAQCRVAANTAFVDSSLDWAGQVNWHVSAPKHYDCGYLTKGWAVVRQDGSVDACCMDAHNLYPIGHVNDELGSLRTRSIKICGGCNFRVPEHLQEAA